jgi:hypothetical protein
VNDGRPAAGHGSASVRAVRAARTVRFGLDYSYERDGRTAWFTTLSLRGLQRRTTVRLDCRAGGCPARGGSLHGLLGRRLRPGARIAIRITHPGLIGRLVRLTVGSNPRPTVRARCLTPGGGQARVCR